MAPAISIQGVGKEYRIGEKQHDTLRDQISGWFRPRPVIDQSHFWALRDVSFEIQPGEVIGVIGRNGAGKSTLLKILSQITDPTEGEVRIRGRVASLLEVGTGFHPELSGRENVYLNGAILGMSRSEIQKKFDEIVAFAEVEKFIDTPVKHYSSGMYVRLAFAVAAHLEPEILIVDEVLAVGDGAFQRKCLGKMGDVARGGRTILFVSHNLTAIRTLCGKCAFLEKGRLLEYGPTEEVTKRYLERTVETRNRHSWTSDDAAQPGDESRLLSARLIVPHDTEIVTVVTPLELEFEVWNSRPDAELNLSTVLYTEDDVAVFNSVSRRQRFSKGIIRGVCRIPGNFLNDLCYRVRILLVESGQAVFDQRNVLSFEVAEIRRESSWHGKWIGLVRPKLEWEVAPVESSVASPV